MRWDTSKIPQGALDEINALVALEFDKLHINFEKKKFIAQLKALDGLEKMLTKTAEKAKIEQGYKKTAEKLAKATRHKKQNVGKRAIVTDFISLGAKKNGKITHVFGR